MLNRKINMQLDSIIISVLYNHFYKMKERGRKVVPWFQTISVLSFSIVVLCGLLILIFLELINGGHYKIRGEEALVIGSFMLLVILIFILIKRYYFNTNKHISYLEEFNTLPLAKQKQYKFFVMVSFVLLPFLLLFVLYIFDKRI
jgi:hypothetical protein